jgi:signal transduction histidine kinase
MRVKWRPSLRTILLLINVVVMLLPLGGIAWLRLYESALVRQTESELLAQGTVIAAAFKTGLVDAPPGPAAGDNNAPPQWEARPPRLDLSVDPIYPRPPDAITTTLVPDPRAVEMGRRYGAVLQEVRLHTLAGIRVADRNGIVVASTAGDIGGQLTQDEVTRALRGETVSVLRERSPVTAAIRPLNRTSGIRVFVALPMTVGDEVVGAVLLARTPASLWDTIQGKRRPLIYAAAILLAIVLMLSWLTTRTLTRPIAALREQAQRAARGESGAVRPLRHAGTREIAELSQSLIAMSSALEERADYIRRFAAQVSHEFKTPLTGIRGAIELLREHEHELTAQERARFETIIAGETDRLDRLVRRLLELARADVAGPGEVRSDPLQALRLCIARARELGMSIASELPTLALTTRMSAEDIETVFNNLLDNVRQHAPGSAVRVDAMLDGDRLQITISDDGPGISAANAAMVFEPFFTTARNAGSTGLGLPIVHALLAAHQADIRIEQGERGTRVVVAMPVI